MKIIRLPLFLTIIFFLNIGNTKDNMSIYDFSFQDIDGNKVKLEKFNGKPILLVNTASRCGFTPQYEGLQNLFIEYRKEILGFYVRGLEMACLMTYLRGGKYKQPHFDLI